jgi:hypothetical protein
MAIMLVWVHSLQHTEACYTDMSVFIEELDCSIEFMTWM